MSKNDGKSLEKALDACEPANDPEGVPLPEEQNSRLDRMLEVLRETGSFAAAVRAVYDPKQPPSPPLFYWEYRNNPEFAARVEEARLMALGRYEQEVSDRVFEGVPKKIVHRGEVVGEDRLYSDPLLLRTLQRMSPGGSWDSKNKAEQTSEIPGDSAAEKCFELEKLSSDELYMFKYLRAKARGDVVELPEPQEHPLKLPTKQEGDDDGVE